MVGSSQAAGEAGGACDPVADQGFLPDQRHLPRVADDAALLAGNPPWRRLCGGGGMSAAQFIPSPLGGEGYGALPLKAAGRSWMRGRSEERRVGREWGSTCRFRWRPEYEKKKIKN